MTIKLILFQATSIVSLFLVQGCSFKRDYIETVRNGIKNVPHVQEITRLFPNDPTDHFITNYGFDKEKAKQWNTVVYFGGRYVLTYQTDVMIDYKTHIVLKVVSKPTFSLWEVSKVSIDSSGQVGTVYAPGYTIGEGQWRKLVESHGNFAAIGITLKTNAPVPGFDKYIHAWRKDRISVND